jgi:hypothetical protein
LLFDQKTADVIALTALVAAVLAILLAIAAHLRANRVRRSAMSRPRRGAGRATEPASSDLPELSRELADARQRLESARAELADALRHVSVVRYDAFGDMGGRLSFSAALLDDDGDGLLLTSINGRTETRTYAKGVKQGACEQAMSPEEEQAIRLALRGSGNGRRRQPA